MLYLLPILFLILLLIYFHLTEYDLFHPVLQTISKEDFDNTANIVSLSIDPYRHNFDKVMEMLKNIYKMRKVGSDEQGRSNKFEKLILNIDHKKLDIDGEIFNLESDYGKEWKINGKKIKINVDAKEWKVDINESEQHLLSFWKQ